jgi:hypothetical protein
VGFSLSLFSFFSSLFLLAKSLRQQRRM